MYTQSDSGIQRLHLLRTPIRAQQSLPHHKAILTQPFEDLANISLPHLPSFPSHITALQTPERYAPSLNPKAY